ncbi:MAG: hypothetical protein JO352_24125 [Chloroflexi bacterium]|nr:hypothetical protein [Chloroflexota bacterium]
MPPALDALYVEPAHVRISGRVGDPPLVPRDVAKGLGPWACALAMSATLACAMNAAMVRAWPADPGPAAAETAGIDPCTLPADVMLYATHDQLVPADDDGLCGGALGSPPVSIDQYSAP